MERSRDGATPLHIQSFPSWEVPSSIRRMRDASSEDLEDLADQALTHKDNGSICGFPASMQLEEQVSCIPAKIRQLRPTGATASSSSSSSSHTQALSTSPSILINIVRKMPKPTSKQSVDLQKIRFVSYGLYTLKKCFIEYD